MYHSSADQIRTYWINNKEFAQTLSLIHYTKDGNCVRLLMITYSPSLYFVLLCFLAV